MSKCRPQAAVVSPVSSARRSPETALCGRTLGTPWRDLKRRKSYSDGRSNSSRSRGRDRAAELTHEDGHIVGPALLRTGRGILVLYADAVIGNNQLDLIG